MPKYQLLLLGDREFHSVKLAYWLHSKGIDFVLRQKQDTYIRQPNSSDQRLKTLGLVSGVCFFTRIFKLPNKKVLAHLI
jgi:hypothetical protein